MLIYNHHPLSGAFVGSTQAEPDPLELEKARAEVFNPLAEAAQARFDSAAALTDPEDQAAWTSLQAIWEADVFAAREAAEAVQPTVWLVPAHATKATPPACVEGERPIMTADGWVVAQDGEADIITEEPALPEEPANVVARAHRDQLIASVRWLIDRHRDELALGLSTTLTGEDYLLVLQYVQDLRDVPEQSGFPHVIAWPTLPSELLATGD